MTKAEALRALGRTDEALATRRKALAMGTQVQVHGFGRGLLRQGRQDEAFEVFRANIAKDPQSWVAHNETARIAVARGDYDTAIKEMKLAVTAATGTMKSQNSDLVTLLEHKVDINK